MVDFVLTMEHEEAGLYNLADETLVHICSFLPTIDIIALSNVCQRFRLLCSDSAVVRNTHFQMCFQLSEFCFKKYLEPKIVFSNIEILNLNYCYWLPATAFSKIGKLKNLKELHILDCQVSFAILRKILSDHHLRGLSWTWRSPVNLKNAPAADNFDSLREHLTSLRHLLIHMSCIIFLNEIINFVYACVNLEGLEINNLYSAVENRSESHSSLFLTYGRFQSRLPSPVKKLKFFASKDLNKRGTNLGKRVVSDFTNKFANAVAQWNVLWITQTGSQFLYDWWKKEKLSLDILISANALNLSGSWPVIPDSRPYTPRDLLEWELIYKYYQGDRNEGYEFALMFLNHGEEVKCRKLSLDDSGLTPELLCTMAQKCPNVEYLSMVKCMVHNYSYSDHVSGATIGIIEAFNRICVNCSKITHLNLAKTEIGIEFSAFANLKHLTSLSISTWTLGGVGQVYPKDYSKKWSAELLNQFRDQTELTEELLKTTRMWGFAEACPQLIRLAIVDLRKPSQTASYDFAVLDAEYACISQFKQLQHLCIQDPGYLGRGASMVHILKGCTSLVTLRLKNVGIAERCKYIPHLTSALVHAKSLESLSILQTRLHLPATFYESLSKCSNLLRFRLSLLEEDIDSPNRIYSLVEQLPKLSWLQVRMKSSIVSCKALEARFAGLVKERPCFTFSVANESTPRCVFKVNGPHVYLDGFSTIDK